MEKLAFGPFCLDVPACRVLRDGVDLELRPQAFSALRVLVRCCGKFVDYEHMIREAWAGTVVTKHTVAVTIGEVKKALQEYGSWISYRPGHGYRLEVPKADDLIRMAGHLWHRQTREGMEKALGCFERAAREDSADFRAFQGISQCHLLLGTYGMRPPREMYRGFLEAHRRAVALAGLTPGLRSDRAHGLHVFERRIDEAETELLRAQQEEPHDPILHIRLIMLYATSGRLAEAARFIAQPVDPLWPTLPAAEIFVQLSQGDVSSALISGKQAVDLHPYMPISRSLYAQALEACGQVEEAFRQHRLAYVLSPDLPWLRAVEGACLARHGRQEEAAQILEELEQLRGTEYVDAYFVTLLLDALGRHDDAFRELERAHEENSATLFLLNVDPRMESLRSDPRFERLLKWHFHPAGTPAVHEPVSATAL